MTNWLCDRCGATNDSTADFCARCGADGLTAKQIAIQRAAAPTLAAGSAWNQHPGETIEQTYLRQTRNATVFIAWVVGIIVVIILILGIIVAKTLSDLHNASNLGLGPTRISQGGYGPNF